MLWIFSRQENTAVEWYLCRQKYHNKARMEEWQVTFKQQSLKLRDLPRAQLDLIKQQQDRPSRKLQLDEMEQSRQREARCISNYFNIPSIATFAQTLITAAKVLRIDPQPIITKIANAKIKLPSTSLEKAQQTTRSRIELCFSRRWRQLQWTIYLLLQQYQTPQGNLRTRVLVINQRGLILQTFSNIHSHKAFEFLARMLLASYTRLQNLVVLESHPRMVDLDNLKLLRSNLPAVNVVLVSYGSRSKLEGLNGSDLVGGCRYYIMQSQIKLSVFSKLDIILWYIQQNDQQILASLSLGLANILRYELQVVGCFKDLQYEHHQFNQKQFFLRLFSFYFNFFVLGMQSCSGDQMKKSVLDECTEQLMTRNRQVEQVDNENKVHSFSNMPTTMQCPVCKKRSKITCLKCCKEFGSKFAICESCFEKFHQDRIEYAGKINKRKAPDDLVIQNLEKEQKETEEKEEEVEHVLARVQNIQQLRQKWRSTVEGYQKDLEHFMRMSQMNFIPRKFVDRVQLLRVKIGQIAAASPSVQTFIKQEQ